MMRSFLRIALAGPLLAILLAIPTRAAFVSDYFVALEQPDGSKVTVYLTGDEFYSTAADANGYTVLRHPDTGWIVYAERLGDDLVPNDMNAAWDVFAIGPLSWTPTRYMVVDMRRALGIAAGLLTPSLTETYWLDVNRNGASSGRVDITDAALITRKIAGLDANP